MPPDAEPPPPGGRLRRLLRLGHVSLKGLLAAVFVPLAVLLLVLMTAGVPRPILRHLVARLERSDLHVDVGRIRWNPLEGVVLKHVRWYGDPERKILLMEAKRCSFSINPLEWLAGRHGLRALRLRGLTARLHFEAPPEGGVDTRPLVLDRVGLAAWLRPDGVRIDRFEALVEGFRIEGSGSVRRRFAAKDDRAPSRSITAALNEYLRKTPPWLRKALDHARAIRHGAPARVNVEFHVVVDDPSRTRLAVRAQGDKTTTPGGVFDGWEVNASLEKSRCELGALTLRQGDARLNVSGTLNLADRQAEFRLFNNLPLRRWLALCPARWRERLARSGVRWDGRAELEMWGGPAPLAELPRRLSGWISLEQAELAGIWVEKAYVAFQRQDDVITLDRLDGVFGRGTGQGPMKARGVYNLSTREYHASLDGGFDPNELRPIFNSNQLAIVDWFAFDRQPPSGFMEASGVVGDPTRFALDGEIDAEQPVYRGVRAARCRTRLTLKEGVMRLDPLVIVREEGAAEGWLEIDYNRRVVAFSADSTLNPHALAGMIGPASANFLEPYRFEGVAHVTASGRVGYASHAHTDIEAFVEGTRMGWAWALADQASFRVRALRGQVDLLDLEARLYGGSLTGRLSVVDVDRPRRTGYRSAGVFQDIRFADLVKSWAKVEGQPYQGVLSGEYEVAGLVGKGRGPTARGRGRLRIVEGQLFQIPLMGGLSHLLARVYPGLGFAAQTDFDADFVIADSRFRTEAARLEGSVLSLVGQGDYHFDERLDMGVQVQLLRKGQVVDVLRLATLPVTKLLEFQLSGTVREPRWRPINLPKELFMIFD